MAYPLGRPVFENRVPRRPRCARWWLLFVPGVAPGVFHLIAIARPWARFRVWSGCEFGLAELELAMGLEPATC